MRSPLKQALWDFIRDVSLGAPGRCQSFRFLRPLFHPLAEILFDINVPFTSIPLRILDIGCGFGDFLYYCQQRGAETLGVDFNARAVEMAQKMGVKVLHGALENQDLPAEYFDVAIASHSLEHLPSPIRTLRHVANLLRPGGTIHLAVPNAASAGCKLEGTGWIGMSFPIHFWFFDKVTMGCALKEAGFHNIRLRTRNLWQLILPRLKTGHFSRYAPIILKTIGIDIKEIYDGDWLCATASLN